jgi:hypothetical protein
MKTRKEMLAHPRVSANYKLLNTARTPAMICRGLTKTDLEFHYSTSPLWSDYCAGWIPESKTRLNCLSCEIAQSENNKVIKVKNEVKRESGNNNSKLRTPSKPSVARSSKVSRLHTSKKHSSKSDTRNANAKNKKNKKATRTTQKKKKRK